MPRYSFTDRATGKRYSIRFDEVPSREDFEHAVDEVLKGKKSPPWTAGGMIESAYRSAGEVGSRHLGSWGWGALAYWERTAAEMDRYWGWASDESIQERLDIANYADDLARETAARGDIAARRLKSELPQHEFAASVGAAIPSLAPAIATIPVGGALWKGGFKAGQIGLGALSSGGVSGAAELQRQRVHRLKQFEDEYGHLGREEVELMALMDSTLPALGAAAITTGVTAATGGLGARYGVGGGVESIGVRGGGAGKLADWMSRGGWGKVAAKSAGAQAVLEGVEEGIDEALQSYAVRRLTTNPELTFSDAIDAGVEAMKVGAVLGGFAGPIGSRRASKEADEARSSAAMLAEIRGNIQKQEAAAKRERLRLVQPRADETALEVKLREEIMAKPFETPTEIIKRKTQEAAEARETPKPQPTPEDLAAAASLVEGTTMSPRPQVAEEFRESALPVRPPESPEAEIEKVAKEESKEMEPDVLEGGGLRPTPLRTSNQIFPIGRAARKRKADREAAAVQPAEFTSPEAVAETMPPISQPDPVSKEAAITPARGSARPMTTTGTRPVAEVAETPESISSDLSFLAGPETLGKILTTREQAALKREEKGRIVKDRSERRLRDKAKKKLAERLKDIQKKRKKKVKIYSGLAAIEGITDAMINTGLDAGIAAAELSNSATTVMRASLDAMKASNPKVFATLDKEELKAAMAGRIADHMKFLHGGRSKVASEEAAFSYQDNHQEVTVKKGWEKGNVYRYLLEGSGDIFREFSLSSPALHPSQVTYLNEKLDRVISYTEKEIRKEVHPDDTYATSKRENEEKFEKLIQQWEDQPVDGPFQEEAIELNLALLKGDFIEARRIAGNLKEVARRIGDGRTEELFTPTKKKLEKLRATLRGYMRKTRGRMNSNPIPMLTASAADAALSVAISALNAGATIKEAVDRAYASVGLPAISEARFRDYMVTRMLAALEAESGNDSIEESIKTATSTDTDSMPAEIKKRHREIMDEADRGLIPTEMATQDALKVVNGNAKNWLWAMAIGRSEDTATELGFKLVGNRINFQQFLRQRLSAMFSSMVFDREGGWNSSKGWKEMWLTTPTAERVAAKEEVESFRREMHIHEYEGGRKPNIERLSPLARSLYDGIDEAWVAMGKYAAAHPVYIIDEKGNVEKGKFEIGKGGSPMVMLPVERDAINNLNKHSEVDDFVRSIIDRVGKTAPEVKDLNSLIHWRDQSRTDTHKKDKAKWKETPSQMFSPLEKKRRNPIHSSMLDFTVDSFHQYIENWAKRMSEIEAYGQKIDPAYDGQDIFDITLELLESKHGLGGSGVSRHLESIRNSVYGINSPAMTNVKKGGALLESIASLTMLTGLVNALRNVTGALQARAGASYAGNPAAVRKALSVKKIMELQKAGFDTAHLRSWGVLKQDMVDLMTGYESTDSAVSGAVKKIDRALSKVRKRQKVALSATLFKGSEFGVRWLSAVTAHVLVTDAIEAKRVGDNPKLVDEFESFAGDMKNVNVKKLLEGDKKATEDFIVRFVTDTQGGYTPNQLPVWITTPMGRFMGKFMPYGIMMNQFHQKNLRRRLERRKGRHGNTLGYALSAGDLLKMAVLFGAGGEAFAWLLEVLTGRERGRDIATWKEILSGDEKPLTKRAAMLYDRWHDSILYTGALGAVVEAVEGGLALAGQDTRSKDLLDPAGLAILNNTFHFIQDARSQGAIDWRLFDKYAEKQVSLWRYGKRMAYQGANAVGVDWDRAVRFQRRRDYYILRNSAKRFADEQGIDVDVMLSGGRFKPNPYRRFYEDVKDNLYVGNAGEALSDAVTFAEDSGVERDKSWQRLANSITRSQPLKVGDYTATDVQKEYMSWARKNLPHDDYARIQSVQSVYTDTAKRAGLISGGNPMVKANAKKLMTGKLPAIRRGRGRPSGDPFGYTTKEGRKSIFGY